jgi:TctA family transporter
VQAMTASQGSLTVFFARPLAAALGVIAIAVWLVPAFTTWRARRRSIG